MRGHDSISSYIVGFLFLIGLSGSAGALGAAPAKLPQVAPEAAGMSGERLAEIDRIVAEGFKEKSMPGCVVAVGRRGKLVLLKAYGDRQTEPDLSAWRPMNSTSGNLGAIWPMYASYLARAAAASKSGLGQAPGPPE